MPFEAFARFLNGESSLDDLRNDLTREIQDHAMTAMGSRAAWDNSFDPSSNENYHRAHDAQLYDRATGRAGGSLVDVFAAHLNGAHDAMDYQSRMAEIRDVRNEYVARNTYDPVDDRIRHDIATGQDPRYNNPYPSNPVVNDNPVDSSYETLRDFNNYNLYNNLW